MHNPLQPLHAPHLSLQALEAAAPGEVVVLRLAHHPQALARALLQARRLSGGAAPVLGEPLQQRGELRLARQQRSLAVLWGLCAASVGNH